MNGEDYNAETWCKAVWFMKKMFQVLGRLFFNFCLEGNV